MKNLPRILAFLVVIIAISIAFYQARQTANLREKNANLQTQQAGLCDQLDKMQRELAEAKSRLATLLADQLKRTGNDAELLKLRAEITKLSPLQKNIEAWQKMASQSVATGLARWKPADARNVGRATPQDAVQSFVWAVANTNLAAIEQSVIPPDAEAGTAAKIYDFLKGDFGTGDTNLTDIRVLSQSVLAPDEAQIELQFNLNGIGISRQINLQNVNDEWKFMLYYELDNVGKPTGNIDLAPKNNW